MGHNRLKLAADSEQATAWTSNGVLLGPFGMEFSEIWSRIQRSILITGYTLYNYAIFFQENAFKTSACKVSLILSKQLIDKLMSFSSTVTVKAPLDIHELQIILCFSWTNIKWARIHDFNPQ